MPSAFARGTDDTGKKGTTSLIRAEGAALGGITITAAERATGSWARRAPVAGAEVAALIMLSATSSRAAIPIPVTVSIAAESSGAETMMRRVRRDAVSASLGITSV